MDLCPCGSGNSFEHCCGSIISGRQQAKSAEALMRSRYTAYTQADMDYIQASMREPASEGFDPVSAKSWALDCEWLGLDVLNASDDTVTFKARYRLDGKVHVMYEKSQFRFIEGRWYYVSGVTPKLGRNDPCCCGSGKKYKKCCG